MKPLDYRTIERKFDRAVNMTSEQIRAWLETDESKSVGFRYPGQKESVGRQSARKIIKILEHGPATDQDFLHMRKVVGYVVRHTAQRPKKDITHTPFRASLMNWGHDPLGIGEL